MSTQKLLKENDTVQTQCRKLLKRILMYTIIALCMCTVSLSLYNVYLHSFPDLHSYQGGYLFFKENAKVKPVSPEMKAMTSVDVNIVHDTILHTVSDRFASLAIDTGIIRNKFRHFDPSSKKLITLATALNPSYLRVGGTAEDLLLFNQTVGDETNALYDSLENLPLVNFTMTIADFDKINEFSRRVGWDLVFGLNILLRNKDAWDPANAQALLRYAQDKGYKMDLELGNEPNSFQHVFGKSLDPSQAGQDFGKLKSIMKSMSSFRSQLLIGPDVTKPVRPKLTADLGESSQQYLTEFLKSGKDYVDVVSFHHYYVRSQTTVWRDFINATILDSLVPQIEAIQKVLSSTGTSTKPLWTGECGTASGGGAAGLSNRYIAGFMLLDRLGLSASHGVDVVIRQTFIMGHYAMINPKDYTPYPDYWLTLLYKRLVGTRVLKAELGLQTRDIRVYAHCTRTGKQSPYNPGAITLYVLNLLSSDIELHLSEYEDQPLDLYLLTPGKSGNLTSRTVKLNGKKLAMSNQSDLPSLSPVKQTKGGPVNIRALSFGFIVIPSANVSLCNTP